MYNKSLLIISVTILALLQMSPFSFSQHASPNLVGLYTSPDGIGGQGSELTYYPLNVYLVLIRPEGAEGDTYSGIFSFDCQLSFSHPGAILKLDETINGSGINRGDAENIQDGYLEYIVDFLTEVPVVDGTALLVSLQLMNLNPYLMTVYTTADPASLPVIPGEMSYSPDGVQREIMYPDETVFGDRVVFIFGHTPTNAKKSSFGSVKALFR